MQHNPAHSLPGICPCVWGEISQRKGRDFWGTHHLLRSTLLQTREDHFPECLSHGLSGAILCHTSQKEESALGTSGGLDYWSDPCSQTASRAISGLAVRPFPCSESGVQCGEPWPQEDVPVGRRGPSPRSPTSPGYLRAGGARKANSACASHRGSGPRLRGIGPHTWAMMGTYGGHTGQPVSTPLLTDLKIAPNQIAWDLRNHLDLPRATWDGRHLGILMAR